MATNLIFVAEIRDTSYAAVAALVFLAWDMLINLADEVEYIWRRPKGKMSWMYAFIRHMPILAQGTLIVTNTSNATGVHFSSTGCRAWLSYQAAVMEVVILSVEIVLITRVYALYNCNKIMLTAISTLFVLEVTAMITALCLSVPKMTFTPECLVSGAPALFMACWISSLAFETILFALTLVKFFRHARHCIGKRSLMNVFMRDGTWAFALIFVAMLLNTLMYQLNHSPLAGICFNWAMSVMSFAGSHLILNLRRYCWEGESSVTVQTMMFEPDCFGSGNGCRLECPSTKQLITAIEVQHKFFKPQAASGMFLGPRSARANEHPD
ncbi:hypothetical protein A0H81_03308 [Grifola frondosa]|uniref:DUF6533 domain-containing protein n=1 Tax=Grifola frondosa TaxID=5627 RepID=A0A1C7MJS1_GRIFR|nr:hypothetical protein A0H81_03308 [Grifola frondosa]